MRHLRTYKIFETISYHDEELLFNLKDIFDEVEDRFPLSIKYTFDKIINGNVYTYGIDDGSVKFIYSFKENSYKNMDSWNVGIRLLGEYDFDNSIDFLRLIKSSIETCEDRMNLESSYELISNANNVFWRSFSKLEDLIDRIEEEPKESIMKSFSMTILFKKKIINEIY